MAALSQQHLWVCNLEYMLNNLSSFINPFYKLLSHAIWSSKGPYNFIASIHLVKKREQNTENQEDQLEKEKEDEELYLFTFPGGYLIV